MRRPWPTLLIVGALAGSAAVAARAEAPRAGDPGELPPLPEVRSTKLPDPTQDDLQQLDGTLTVLVSSTLEERRAAASELKALSPRMVSAVDVRLEALADRCDREAMKSVLEKARRQARERVRAELKAEGRKGKVVTPDYLDALVDYGQTESKTWQDLVIVVGLSRALSGIGTVEAVRELIDVYTRFGEFLRVDTQLSLERLGDKAVAALIEARRHRAEKIARWAERQLDALGKAIPSEAVQTTQHDVLADILRAYGRVRDPDAARIVISFANSERAQVREAARQAVALMGEVSNWQLRDGYETVVGKRAPRDWAWDRTARELFAEFDRQRLAQVHKLFDEGMLAREKGDLDAMRTSFDQVLARSPFFERGADMAAGYEAFAREVMERDPDLAIDALRRAARLGADESARQRVTSLRLALEARRLTARGLADQELVRRALELDPENATARALRDQAQRGPELARAEERRWWVAIVIGAITLVAMGFIALLPRLVRRSTAARPGPDPSPPGHAGPIAPTDDDSVPLDADRAVAGREPTSGTIEPAARDSEPAASGEPSS